VAVLVTIITNLLCFLITPTWLVIMLGGRANVGSLNAVELIQSLLFIVVLPMAAAQLLRLRREVAGWATRHKKSLGLLTQCGILSFVFTGAVQTGERLNSAAGAAIPVADLALMVVLVVGLHTAMLFLGLLLARLCRLPRGDAVAVGFAGSQKTLMVGLGIAVESGFSVLPIITYHVGQLLIDTLVADHWRLKEKGERGTLVP
jgi:sodium/bile acid cotransporter 7